MAELRGEFVRLRALRREDLPALQRWLDLPQVGLFVGHQQGPVGLADIERWFAQMVADESERAYAIENEAGNLIGYCVVKLTWEHREAHLGAICIDPAAQRQGYGTDALRSLVHFLFDELGVHRISTGTHAVNEPAIRLCEKIGFVREGTQRERWFHAGAWHDAALFGLLRTDFQSKA